MDNWIRWMRMPLYFDYTPANAPATVWMCQLRGKRTEDLKSIVHSSTIFETI